MFSSASTSPRRSRRLGWRRVSQGKTATPCPRPKMVRLFAVGSILKRHLNSPAAAPSREDVQVFTAAGWAAKHEQTIEYCMKPVEISLNSSRKPTTPIADHKYTAPEAHSATTRIPTGPGEERAIRIAVCVRSRSTPSNALLASLAERWK